MWQRIQTLFLVIAIISLILSMFYPIWVYEIGPDENHKLSQLNYAVSQNGMTTEDYLPYCITGILTIAAMTIAVIEIRKYKDRVLQMKLGALNSLFMAGSIAAAVIFSNQLEKLYPGGQHALGLWLPGIAVVCNLVSNRFIRRDERIVRDSDRLR
jgi:Na+-transporting NADH:ubiquinone oxidoreductase subunit NqrE